MVSSAEDMNVIAKIFNHPKVYEWVTDDTTDLPFVPGAHEMYLVDGENQGAVRIDKLTGTTCMVHIATLPEMRCRTGQFVKECVAWVFGNTIYSKIVSLAPVSNRAAVVFAKRCGFKEEGRITQSFLKNWTLHDQIVFGLSKYDKEALCQ